MTQYATVTLDLKWGQDRKFKETFAAAVPLLKKQGVTLLRAWIAAIGQYRKVVSVWEAQSHAKILAALADPELTKLADRLASLGSVHFELATLLVKGPKQLSAEERKGGVICTGTVTLKPGGAPQFAKILEGSLSTMASHGVFLEASFLTQVGNRDRVLDLWWARSANSVYGALSDPMLDAPADELDYSAAMAGELVEVSTELNV